MMEDFDYNLPEERIARYPAPERDGSRLLVTRRDDSSCEVQGFSGIVDLFSPGDVLVVNETKVFPARLLGRKPTGAAAEIFLLRPAGSDDDAVWEALVRPGGKLKPGREVIISDELTVRIEDGAPGGGRRVRLVTDLDIDEALGRYGEVPLPPYLGRGEEPEDRDRYQTVYARVRGSVAAPTAGLHFTDPLLRQLKEKGVTKVPVVLHVGMGTFRPVSAEDVEDHEMHREVYDVPESSAEAINEAKASGGQVWAVGTTVVRTLETLAQAGRVAAGRGETDLFIRPGFDFQVVDRLITNFHLPRSTLMMLVGAFAGVDLMKQAYQKALEEGFRFYSYGDAMVIL